MKVLPVADQEALALINLTTCILSAIGCSWIILFYLKFKDIQNFMFELVFFMSIAVFGASIFDTMWKFKTGSVECYVQAIGYSYFNLASIFWSASISFTLDQAYILEKESFSEENIRTNRKWYLLFGWGLPGILSLLPLSTNSYGSTHGRCWIIHGPEAGTAWAIVQFYLWLWIIVFYSLYIYIRTRMKMKTRGQSINDGIVNQRARNVMNYPMVLVVAWSLNGINQLYQAATHGDHIVFLSISVEITQGLFGFFNAVVYMLTPDVKRQMNTLCPTEIAKVPLRMTKNERKMHQIVQEISISESQDLGDDADEAGQQEMG